MSTKVASSLVRTYQPAVRVVITEGCHVSSRGGKTRTKPGGASIRVYLSMDAEAASKAEALLEAERISQVGRMCS
jgi:hypothetical protein